MAENRGAIKYTSRDYDNIMEEFWELVPKLSELWKPEAEADPGVVLGKFLASIADMLGVNADWLANEIFAPSVSQRKNAEKLFALIGYNLGWFTAARTEVTFTNNSGSPMTLDFGFNGNNFCTLNAFTDITQQARVITYNILPLTNKYGAQDTRSRRQIATENLNVFVNSDVVKLNQGDSITRVAIEGELRSYSVSVQQIKDNNYIIRIPSQHLDTTAVWIKAKPSAGADEFLTTQWIQVTSPADFITPEPRFAVNYDNYSNAQIIISSYLNQLENYDSNYLVVYWVDCSGIIGSVGGDVLQNFLPANPDTNNWDENGLTISNLSNTVELPHTHTVTGSSPETAKEAYHNSRNFINTHDSLITLPDFNRFLNRTPGVDTGLVIDCQKALEINLAIYNDVNLTDSQKSKMYIGSGDIPALDEPIFNWQSILNLGFNPEDPLRFVFQAGFATFNAFCFGIHNDFQNSDFGQGRISNAQIRTSTKFQQYRMPILFEQVVIRDYIPIKAMSVETLTFCWSRIFPFYIVGEIWPKNPVSIDVGNNIIAKVKEDLAIAFSPAVRKYGQRPTTMEVVNIIRKSDTRIDYFDAGSINNPIINWRNCDVEYWNPISFARYQDLGPLANNLRIAPSMLVRS